MTEPNTPSRRDSLAAVLTLALAADAGAQTPPASTRNAEAFRALSQRAGDKPVVMLNLLKFKPGGQAQYMRYSANFQALTRGKGVRIRYAGQCEDSLIGKEDWDMIAVVEYPSRKAFLAIVQSPEYQKITGDRTAALERAVLYSTSEMDV